VLPDDPVCSDLSGMVLRLAAEAGQVSLAMTASSAGARASVDQHAAEIRDALAKRGRAITPAALLSYAQGFAGAAIARGWWPPHRRENLHAEAADWASPGAGDHSGATGWTGSFSDDLTDPLRDGAHRLDWESLRLAAVCQMLIESQGGLRWLAS
jgi:hypothetical protein